MATSNRLQNKAKSKHIHKGITIHAGFPWQNGGERTQGEKKKKKKMLSSKRHDSKTRVGRPKCQARGKERQIETKAFLIKQEKELIKVRLNIR